MTKTEIEKMLIEHEIKNIQVDLINQQDRVRRYEDLLADALSKSEELEDRLSNLQHNLEELEDE